MIYYTTNIYQMKQNISAFPKMTSSKSHKLDKKTANMIYGILASDSCHLTDIVNQLHKKLRKQSLQNNCQKRLTSSIVVNKCCLLTSYKAYTRIRK